MVGTCRHELRPLPGLHLLPQGRGGAVVVCLRQEATGRGRYLNCGQNSRMVQQELWTADCHHLVLAAQGRQVVRPGQLPAGAAFQVRRETMVSRHQPCICTNNDGLANRGIIFYFCWCSRVIWGLMCTHAHSDATSPQPPRVATLREHCVAYGRLIGCYHVV